MPFIIEKQVLRCERSNEILIHAIKNNKKNFWFKNVEQFENLFVWKKNNSHSVDYIERRKKEKKKLFFIRYDFSDGTECQNKVTKLIECFRYKLKMINFCIKYVPLE